MSPEARERSFDEIAVGLSSGTLSRSKALKLVGAALVGGLLASLPGIAQAAPPLCSHHRPCPVRCRCVRSANGGRTCIDELSLLERVSNCNQCQTGDACIILRGGRQRWCAAPCTAAG